jgi:hypothetical protein
VNGNPLTLLYFLAGGTTGNSLRDPERRSRDSRGSRVDSGSVDMETPQSLSPRSPLDALEALDGSLTRSSSSAQANLPGTSGTNNTSYSNGIPSSSHQGPLVNGHRNHPSTSNGTASALPSQHPSSSNNNNNNHVIIGSPSVHPVPPPVPVLHPQPVTISHSPSPATPVDGIMVESTHSLSSISDRRVPIVPPRRCRTRSPTPNTSHGKSTFLAFSGM